MKKKPQKQKPIIRKEVRNLRCNFSKEERIELGQSLAESHKQLEELLTEKKQVMSSYKSKADTITAKIAEVSNAIHCGYVIRPIEVEAHFDVPSVGKKRIVRLDDETEVGVEQMTAVEMQRDFIADAEAEKGNGALNPLGEKIEEAEKKAKAKKPRKSKAVKDPEEVMPEDPNPSLAEEA